MLRTERLDGKSFIDVGSGSGLFSLAARRLGAKVYSFDYDPLSVGCTTELRTRYFGEDSEWQVSQGSILDEEYILSLGQFDIVYSWGVLHHTGNMWKALEIVEHLIKSNGQLYIAIYNDQGFRTKVWKRIKRAYCLSPRWLKPFILYPIGIILWIPGIILDLFEGKPFITWKSYYKNRGMSPWRDVVDWVGGYPFEVAKPEEIFEYYYQRGFELVNLRTVAGSMGNNQFLFQRACH